MVSVARVDRQQICLRSGEVADGRADMPSDVYVEMINRVAEAHKTRYGSRPDGHATYARTRSVFAVVLLGGRPGPLFAVCFSSFNQFDSRCVVR